MTMHHSYIQRSYGNACTEVVSQGIHKCCDLDGFLHKTQVVSRPGNRHRKYITNALFMIGTKPVTGYGH